MSKILKVIDNGAVEIYVRKRKTEKYKWSMLDKTYWSKRITEKYYMNGHIIKNTKPCVWGCEGYLVSFLDIVDYGIALGAINIQIIGDRCFIFSLKETMVVNIYDLYDAIKLFKENEDDENIDMIGCVDCLLCDKNKAIIKSGTKSNIINPLEIMIGAITLDDGSIMNIDIS